MQHNYMHVLLVALYTGDDAQSQEQTIDVEYATCAAGMLWVLALASV